MSTTQSVSVVNAASATEAVRYTHTSSHSGTKGLQYTCTPVGVVLATVHEGTTYFCIHILRTEIMAMISIIMYFTAELSVVAMLLFYCFMKTTIIVSCRA